MERENVEGEDAVLGEVTRWARNYARVTVHADAADDVAQDVVVALFEKMRSGKPMPSGARLRGLVRRMVRCRLIDELKRDRRRSEREARYARDGMKRRPVWMSPEAEFDDSELRRVRESTLNELPGRCRRAYVMVQEQRFSYERAAQALMVSPATIASYIVVAHRALRRRMEELGIVAALRGLRSRRAR